MPQTRVAPGKKSPEQDLPPAKITVSKARIAKETVFFHSGDAGDIIYALLFIKSLGGGGLYIGPDPKWNTNSNRDRQRYDWILPLIKAQPYIKWASVVPGKPDWVNYDLNLFREVWMVGAEGRKAANLSRLFEAYPARFKMPPLPEDEPWLSVVAHTTIGKPIVIHRSHRYRNPEFPWREAAQRYGGQMIFVGLQAEYIDWVSTYGKVAEFKPTRNALEIAQLIAGSKLFIGNQSCPNAMALGLGVPVVQEVSLVTPDCVFNRKGSQFVLRGPVDWPAVGRRFVSAAPNKSGLIEIGPCADASGLGDYLTVTPVARELGDRCVMKIPKRDERIAPLFQGLCKVEINDECPYFQHVGGVLSTEAKLRSMRLRGSLLPEIRITEQEREWARKEILAYPRPLSFVPSCAPHWAHLRQRPPAYWAPVIHKIGSYSILQFGREDYPLVEGAIRMPFYELRQLAAIYSVIGRYLGVDTGDHHLMLAAGGKVVVAHPDEQEGYSHKEWHYPSDRASYVNFSKPGQIPWLF